MKSPWWIKHTESMAEEIPQFNSLEEAVIYAQTVCPFDHRAEYNHGVIKASIDSLKEEFRQIPNIKDSIYSWQPSIKDGYSDMFLMHLYFYMRIIKDVEIVPKKILEIGGGYGETARIFLTLYPDIEYTIIDLEESLYFSKAYLTLNCNKNIRYFSSEAKDEIRGEKFDLVINTVSCQEMLPEVVQEYIRFIENDIDVEWFYWLNYMGNSHSHAELSFDERPPIDKNWTTIYEKTNPKMMRITSPRNFLELLLKRTKKEDS